MKEEFLEQDLETKFPLYYKTCIFLQKNIFYKNIFDLHVSIPVDPYLAEKICIDAYKISGENWTDYTTKLKNLFDLNVQFLKLQTELEKKGRYHFSTFKEVEEYFSQFSEEGVDYLWGLYFSQIFWVTHHRLFNFFIKNFVTTTQEKGSCLEVPSGSGIYLTHFLLRNPSWTGYAIDLSDSAIKQTKELVKINSLQERVVVTMKDIFLYEENKTYQKIICGELLEHVEDPVAVLKKLYTLLDTEGVLFLTTVAWAAAIDHIYLYKNEHDIREHIARAGFLIKEEYIQKVFPKDETAPKDKNIAINYCALLIKK